MPQKLPPEKAARNRRQAKAEKNGTGRSVTLTEGINVEPSAILDINLSKHFKNKYSFHEISRNTVNFEIIVYLLKWLKTTL